MGEGVIAECTKKIKGQLSDGSNRDAVKLCFVKALKAASQASKNDPNAIKYPDTFNLLIKLFSKILN